MTEHDFGHMSDGELQVMLDDVLRCPSSDDVDFIKALSNEITRRSVLAQPQVAHGLIKDVSDAD